MLTKSQVKKIADLAQIELTDAELEKFAPQISSILEYVNKISELDLKDVEYKSHIEIENVMDEDVAEPGLPPEAATDQTTSKGSYIVVPQVM